MAIEEIKIELTNYCKRGCVHCSSNANTNKRIELNTEKVFDIVNQASELGVKSIVLTGGEATEYNELKTVVNYIKKKGINEIKLYTMCDPTPENLKFLNRLKGLGLTEVVYSLTLSLTTDKALNFDNVEEFLINLSNVMDVSIHYCLTNKSLADFEVLDNIISKLNQDNFKHLSFLRYVEHGRGDDSLTLSSADLKALKPKIIELFKKYPEKIHLGSPFNILNITYTPCTAGEKTFVIGYDGSAYPCDAMKYFDYLGEGGNVYNSTLSEIYNSKYFTRIRDAIKNINEDCKTCSNDKCLGGCLGQKMLQMIKKDENSITTTWYQENALRTINDFESKEALKLNAFTGIIGEYGEFFDYIKKLYTHNLTDEKKEEILKLAPNELGDLVWYLSSSLALYYDYTLDDIYSYILKSNKLSFKIDDNLIAEASKSKDPLCEFNSKKTYQIDLINEYLENIEGKDIFTTLMNFKRTLNTLDDITSRDEAIEAVSNVLISVASISKCLFGKNLSEILISNIEKLRKRYPTGFDEFVANRRIDANKKYKEENDMKVRNLTC